MYEQGRSNAGAWWGAALGIIAVVVIGTGAGVYSSHRWHPKPAHVLSRIAKQRHLARPYGMAPVAFAAYVRACNNAGVNPRRTLRTIADDLPEDGSHRRDGTVKLGARRVDYTAAVDVGTWGLDQAHRAGLMRALTVQGFASWYRAGAQWKGHEHIHAIYALLSMKPELHHQLTAFLAARRAHGDRELHWERRVGR